jgi:hypothetical protein
MNCPNCGSEQTFFLSHMKDKRWSDVQLTYYKCLGCMVEFHLDLKDVEGFYSSGEYESRAGLNPEKTYQITKRRIMHQVAWMDENHPSWRMNVFTILDIGARGGVAVEFLRQLGFDAIGYDLAPTAASEFVITDVSALGNYDMLWMSHVLEHCSSPLETLKFWKGYAKSAFVEIPPSNHQLPHVTVFEDISFNRVMDLAGVRVVVKDSAHLRAVLEW